MVKELAGGEICGDVIDIYPEPVLNLVKGGKRSAFRAVTYHDFSSSDFVDVKTVEGLSHAKKVDSFKTDTHDGAVAVEVDDYNACPRYTGITIRATTTV